MTRFPRVGPVSANNIDAYAKSSSRSFLAWNQQATPVTQVQFEIAISGNTLIASPAGVLYNTAGYGLEVLAQRGSVDANNVFTPYYGLPSTSANWVGNASVTVNNIVYGPNGVAHSTAPMPQAATAMRTGTTRRSTP